MRSILNAKKSEEKLVTLVDGTKIPISEAFYYRGEYYSNNDPDIGIDFITGEKIILKHCHKINCKLGDDLFPSNSMFVFTEISPEERFPLVYFEDDFIFFSDAQQLKAAGYVECLESGVFFHPKHKELAKSTKTGIYRKVKTTASYKGFRGNKLTVQELYTLGVKSPTYSLTQGKKYSFGLELETCFGFLPPYLDKDLNYEAVHDGSLKDADGNVNGGEYVTGVLTGDMGFRQLKRLTNELSKRCQVNKKCGVHVHIGDVIFNKEFIVAMYELSLRIQGDVFSILPKSRRNNEYCRRLPNIAIHSFKGYNDTYSDYIDSYYDEIIKFVTNQSNLNPVMVNKKHDHPMGPKCGYNHSSARYCWLNLVPAIFNTRGNNIYTIEFRPFNGSTNYTKIRNWTLICMGMIYVAENFKINIFNKTVNNLEDVICLSYKGKIQEELLQFVKYRREKFSVDEAESEEYKDASINESFKLKEL